MGKDEINKDFAIFVTIIKTVKVESQEEAQKIALDGITIDPALKSNVDIDIDVRPVEKVWVQVRGR